MGRTKGSKNGIRKVPIKKTKAQREEEQWLKQQMALESKIERIHETSVEESQVEIVNQEPSLPVFNPNVLKYYRSKDYEKCIKLIEKILMNNSDEDKDHYRILLAASYTMSGQSFEKAHEIFDEVLSLDSKNASAIYGKGVAYYFERKMDDSVKMFDEAIKICPGNEMDRARDMKMRVDLERRSAVIMVEKMPPKVTQQNESENDIELPESIEEMIVDLQGTAECLNEAEMPNYGENINQLNQNKMNRESTPEPQVLHVRNVNEADENVSFNTRTSAKGKMNDEPKEKQKENLKTTSLIHLKAIASPQKIAESIEMEQDNFNNPDPVADSSPAPVLKPTPKPTTAEEFYNKGMELYMSGSLKKSLRMFERAIKLNPELPHADEMGIKAQEFIELMDIADLNMTQKNFKAVVEIINEALVIDVTNNIVNRPFYYQRGLALLHLGDNEASIKDYAEFDRLNKILNTK